MKILFISDIHGIKTNLPLIKEIMDKNGIAKLVVLGDLYYIGPRNKMNSNYDIEYVKSFLEAYKDRLICLRGNCDSDVDLNVSNFLVIDGLSTIVIDGVTLYLTHGDHINKDFHPYIDNGILIYGHEHIPYIEIKDKLVCINPGSISLPRVGEATYMIYENYTFTIFDVNGQKINEIKVK